jgi:hypothetical protein
MRKRDAFLAKVFGAKGVKGVLDWSDKGCFIVPDSLIYCGTFLTASQLRLWLCLWFVCQRRNPNSQICWPSRETLSAMMGISERGIGKVINQLVEKHVLRVHQRADGTAYYLVLAIPESYMNRMKEHLPKDELVEIVKKRAKDKAPILPAGELIKELDK